MATRYNDTQIYKGLNKLPSSSNLFTNVHSTCCTDNIETTVELIAMPTFLKHHVIMRMIAIIIISTGCVEWLQHAAGYRVNVSPQRAVTLSTNVPGDRSRPSPPALPDLPVIICSRGISQLFHSSPAVTAATGGAGIATQWSMHQRRGGNPCRISPPAAPRLTALFGGCVASFSFWFARSARSSGAGDTGWTPCGKFTAVSMALCFIRRGNGQFLLGKIA